MINRLQIFRDLGKESAFFWGPRQVGKSTFLKDFFPSSLYYDLLLPSEFERLSRNPEILKEEVLAYRDTKRSFNPIIIDEVQKLPPLLDLVQWLMVNHHKQFILCGSSARKLKRGGANLLGGRALRYELFPLVSAEIDNFDLIRALNHGLIPRHYLSNNPKKMIQSYIGDYLKEEILAEALVRNIPSFHRFLDAAAFTNGEMVNFQNVAQDCGISAPTAKEYFQILIDTLLARYLPAFQKRAKRRVIQTSKFYYFDLGIVNFLLNRSGIKPKTEIFGRVFEHFIFQELLAHSHYSGADYPLSYWRTTSELEVDFVLGNGDVAIEVKSSDQISSKHLKGIKAFCEEFHPKKAIIVSLDKRPRQIDKTIIVLPVHDFLNRLWSGEVY